MEKLIPEKKRYKKTINARTEDINSLYKISILAKLSLHFKKNYLIKKKNLRKIYTIYTRKLLKMLNVSGM